MARSSRRTTVQQGWRQVPSVSRPHPLAMQPIIVHVPVRPNLIRRTPLTQVKVIQRAALPGRRVTTYRRLTKPAVGLFRPVAAKPVALLRDGKTNALKQRKLCKCHNERSAAQSKVSRNFFSRFGGRGGAQKRKEGACQC